MSCQPCGCDSEAKWTCQRHKIELAEKMNSIMDPVRILAQGEFHKSDPFHDDVHIPVPFTPSTHHPQGQNWVGHSATIDTVPYSPVMPKEIRVIDPETGGEKGSKLARFDLIPPEATWALAEVYGRGARKYADRNWERGYAWGLSVAALERHLSLWKQGESIDAETGCHHLMQVAWHAVALFIFELRKLGTDDVRVK